jgi:hypothetical protein
LIRCHTEGRENQVAAPAQMRMRGPEVHGQLVTALIGSGGRCHVYDTIAPLPCPVKRELAVEVILGASRTYRARRRRSAEFHSAVSPSPTRQTVPRTCAGGNSDRCRLQVGHTAQRSEPQSI